LKTWSTRPELDVGPQALSAPIRNYGHVLVVTKLPLALP
jgi:hypothetical protein